MRSRRRETIRASGRGGVARRWIGLVASVCAVTLWTACETAVARTWQAGRLYVRGTEALELGEYDRAISELEEAARLAPRASEVRNHLGLADWEAGESARARVAFEEALALDCDNEAARTNLALLEAAEGAGPLRASDSNGGGSVGSVEDRGETTLEGRMHGR